MEFLKTFTALARLSAVVWMPIAGACALIAAAPALGMGALAAGAAGAGAGLLIGGVETLHILSHAAEKPVSRLAAVKEAAGFIVSAAPDFAKKSPKFLSSLFNKEALNTYWQQKKILREADKKLSRLQKIDPHSEETKQATTAYLDIYCSQRRFSDIVKMNPKK